MARYNPFDWYWIIESTGQIYSSAKCEAISSTDADYEAWVAAGGTATMLQDAATLDDVLKRIGLAVSGLSVVTKSELIAYASDKATTLLATARSYDCGGASVKADATASTISDLETLAAWGATNSSASKNWVVDDSGTMMAVTGAQFVALAPLVGAYRLEIYSDELSAVLAEIASGAITTLAEIDAFSWTV